MGTCALRCLRSVSQGEPDPGRQVHRIDRGGGWGGGSQEKSLRDMNGAGAKQGCGPRWTQLPLGPTGGSGAWSIPRLRPTWKPAAGFTACLGQGRQGLHCCGGDSLQGVGAGGRGQSTLTALGAGRAPYRGLDGTLESTPLHPRVPAEEMVLWTLPSDGETDTRWSGQKTVTAMPTRVAPRTQGLGTPLQNARGSQGVAKTLSEKRAKCRGLSPLSQALFQRIHIHEHGERSSES